ncbi:unnamed protein product [Vitrella brassicaformis CCMP3155]|uniref:Uncharacterized protein n=1 Tax=Vitrella brassicaformis (strain CCMP3155) TaxID=1169540 RepID=A0A0G4FHE6_VITBC|nr:unnamed protein product [Vitrella brassicaformis CCMP3155]|eukprot:CEM12848.1 unnamed protein product [Vitrella brassicaformis CCMP3155]
MLSSAVMPQFFFVVVFCLSNAAWAASCGRRRVDIVPGVIAMFHGPNDTDGSFLEDKEFQLSPTIKGDRMCTPVEYLKDLCSDGSAWDRQLGEKRAMLRERSLKKLRKEMNRGHSLVKNAAKRIKQLDEKVMKLKVQKFQLELNWAYKKMELEVEKDRLDKHIEHLDASVNQIGPTVLKALEEFEDVAKDNDKLMKVYRKSLEDVRKLIAKLLREKKSIVAKREKLDNKLSKEQTAFQKKKDALDKAISDENTKVAALTTKKLEVENTAESSGYLYDLESQWNSEKQENVTTELPALTEDDIIKRKKFGIITWTTDTAEWVPPNCIKELKAPFERNESVNASKTNIKVLADNVDKIGEECTLSKSNPCGKFFGKQYLECVPTLLSELEALTQQSGKHPKAARFFTGGEKGKCCAPEIKRG